MIPAKTIFVLLLISPRVISESPEVVTTTGTIRGFTSYSPSGKTVDVFLGIPYAEPPTGNKRFKHPEKIKPWSGIFDATKQPSSCYQKPVPAQQQLQDLSTMIPARDYSEDCLKLNVWVPTISNNKSLPVMVWIYGGGFARGGISAKTYDGTILSSEENVIVVTINYRVASLGFLYLDHPDIPGNAGQYDQLLALQWIKVNAKVFGGDPDRITIFGQSSGSASVGLHLLSPLSQGLFNRAIMSSASPTSENMFHNRDDAISNAMFLIETIGCSRNNITDTVQCLLSADPGDIIASELHIAFDMVYNYLPVVDGQMFPDEPRTLLQQGQFFNVSLMTGSVKDEFSMFLVLINPAVFPFKDEIKVTYGDAKYLMDLFHWDYVTQRVAEYVYSHRTNMSLNQIIPISLITKPAGDKIFHCPLRDFEKSFSRGGSKVFKYYFPHRSSVSDVPKWLGTYHSQEIPYIFGRPLMANSKYSEEEKLLSRRVMHYWANFARNGDPNYSSHENKENIFWPRYTEEEMEYLVLAPNSTTVGKRFLEEKCVFWQELRPILQKAVKFHLQK